MPNIEELIQRAISEGKFDHLPGKGQPLHLDDNPHADPDWQLTYHMLKENGFTLPWLELRQELENDLAAARKALQQAWEYRQSSHQGPASQDAAAINTAYQRAIQAFTEGIERLNQRIFDYNLQTPLDRFQMRKLDPQAEINRICSKTSQ